MVVERIFGILPARQIGGGGGIRTHEGLGPAGFQDRSHQPLDHPSELFVPRSVPLRTRWASRAAGPQIFSSMLYPRSLTAAKTSTKNCSTELNVQMNISREA